MRFTISLEKSWFPVCWGYKAKMGKQNSPEISVSSSYLQELKSPDWGESLHKPLSFQLEKAQEFYLFMYFYAYPPKHSPNFGLCNRSSITPAGALPNSKKVYAQQWIFYLQSLCLFFFVPWAQMCFFGSSFLFASASTSVFKD